MTITNNFDEVQKENSYAKSSIDINILESLVNDQFPEFKKKAGEIKETYINKDLSVNEIYKKEINPKIEVENIFIKALDNLGAYLGEGKKLKNVEEIIYKPVDISWRKTDLAIAPIVLPESSIYTGGFDIAKIRSDFPILSEKVNGKNLVWFDNAATTQKPKSVIDRIKYFYEHENSNVHRAAHTLAARTTDAYESAREKVAKFINAPSSDNIVFVRGTTEAINLIANTYGIQNIGKDDEIIISWLEHHANIVPWQILSQKTGAKLKIIPVDETGQIILEEFIKLITPRTKLVSVTQVSNALGTVTPIKEIIQIAHSHGIKVLVDGAQGVSHLKVDVQALDADFYVFSGHKIYGPTGIGAIYGKSEILNQLIPYQAGGNMIADVTFEKTIYQLPPNRLEAGTGNIADAVGLGAALDYVTNVGIDNINNYEHYLLDYGTEKLSSINGLKFIGTAKNKTSVLSFVLEGFTNDEIGKALNEEGIAVRTGHHCAQPILRRFGVENCVRPSIAFYNTKDEIDLLVKVVKDIKKSRNY